jgi:hypothetical protein
MHARHGNLEIKKVLFLDRKQPYVCMAS